MRIDRHAEEYTTVVESSLGIDTVEMARKELDGDKKTSCVN
jgi:hypothetical protein